MSKNTRKKNIINIIAILVTGLVIVMEKIANNKKIEELEEKVIDIGNEYNEISLKQERYKEINNTAISMISDEICSIYQHIEELSNIQESKDKHTDENKESQKLRVYEQISKIKKIDGDWR